jgi:DNA-binding transcriptional regulator YdaS (Cro superfamily)
MKPRQTRIDAGLVAVLKTVSRLSDLSEPLRLTVQTVSQWRRVPAERVLDVERITGVSRHVQRPDIYGPEPRRRPLAGRRRVEQRPAA